MASQVVGESACYGWPSYVLTRIHKYKSVWSMTVGERLRLTTELTNPQDHFAVAVTKDSCGHVPRTVSRTVSFSLGRTGASASVK